MPAPADEPLRRVNMYLYRRDWDWLYRKHGHGVSDIIRRLVREHIKEQDKPKEIEWPLKTP